MSSHINYDLAAGSFFEYTFTFVGEKSDIFYISDCGIISFIGPFLTTGGYFNISVCPIHFTTKPEYNNEWWFTATKNLLTVGFFDNYTLVSKPSWVYVELFVNLTSPVKLQVITGPNLKDRFSL